MLFDTIAIVGVGLIGGSVGRAAKARGVARNVIGVGRNREVLEIAAALGAIDAPAEDVRGADLVIVCTPVDTIAATIEAADGVLEPGAIITDVGSTKANIAPRLANATYIGSHPLAGSERSGVEHSTDELFHERMVVVVPGEAEATKNVEQFWRRLGARTQRMTAVEHDRAVAFTSHLPHVVAAALASTLPPELIPFAASGFRDTTRIAAGDPNIWTAILRANRDEYWNAIAAFDTAMAQFHNYLADDDATRLVRWFGYGKEVRDALGR